MTRHAHQRIHDSLNTLTRPITTITLSARGRVPSERVVAESIVESWMNAQGHRENILTAAWDVEGIGLYLTDDNAVYTTQTFC